MKEIDNKATTLLLLELDDEINLKCFELKNKHEQVRLRKTFFAGCFLTVFLFIAQIFFRIINLNFITIVLVYQAILLALIVPMIQGLTKGVVTK